MAIGGPNIYPSTGSWLGISREIYPSTATGIWQLLPFDMNNYTCDYSRRHHPADHDPPSFIVAYGRLKDMKIITRTLCASCYQFIMKQGSVGDPVDQPVEAFRFDEVEIRSL